MASNQPPSFPKSVEDEKKIWNCVKDCSLFTVLSEAERRVVLAAFEPRTYPPNANLIEKGAEGDLFFVLVGVGFPYVLCFCDAI